MSVVFLTVSDKETRLNSEFLTVETLSAILEENFINNEIIPIEYDQNLISEEQIHKIDWKRIKFVGIPFMYEESDNIKYITNICRNSDIEPPARFHKGYF